MSPQCTLRVIAVDIITCNQLIIYIAGDNGDSVEGSPIGTPNKVASIQGVDVLVADQLRYFYNVWGSDQTYPHMAVAWSWAFDAPFFWTSDRVALQRRAPWDGDLGAECDQGRGW
jgi:hypothetical protein